MQKDLFKEIQNDSFVGALLNTDENFNGASIFNRDGTLHFNLLRETVHLTSTFQSFNHAIVFGLNSYLYHSFNDLITGLIENGIFCTWIENKHYRLTRQMTKESDKIVLTMEHLSTGFNIWLCMLTLPMIAFIGELGIFWIPRIYQRVSFRIAGHLCRN